jgi:hypothetical protein
VIGRVGKQIFKIDHKWLLEGSQAAYAIKGSISLYATVHIHPLAGAAHLERTTQVSHIQVVAYPDVIAFKVKVAAETDVLVEQETNVKPQRMTVVQVRTASQKRFQKIASIIT